MESLAQRNPSVAADGGMAKVRACSTQLGELRRDLSKVENSGAYGGRDDLFEFGGPDELDSRGQEQRDRLLMANDKVTSASSSLERSAALAMQTENQGRDTYEKLVGQGNQLREADQNLDTINENMSKSRKILRQMYFKVLSNKLVMIIIILAELLTIGILVYFDFFY